MRQMKEKEIVKIRKILDVIFIILAFVFIIVGCFLVFNLFGITNILQEK